MKAKLIKEGDKYDLYRIDEDGKKVTFASTQDYKQKLSHKNCEAIANGYDLDELAEDNFKGLRDCISDSDIAEFYISLVKTTVTEILGDKKFSEEDVKRAMDVTLNYETKRDAESYQEKIDFLKSLQQTEWDVVIDVLMTEREGGVVIETPKLDTDGCLILKRI